MSTVYRMVLILAVVSILGFTGIAQAELLFSDNFNGAGTPAAPDYALNVGLNSRLSGFLASSMQTKAWDIVHQSAADHVRVNETTGNWNGANELVMTYPGSGNKDGAVIQHNFNDSYIASGGWFSVCFDFDPVSMGSDLASSTANGGGVFIGAKDATASTTPASGTYSIPGRFDPNSDLNIAFLGDGRIKATFAGDGNGGSWSTFDSSPATISQEKIYSFNLTVTLLDNSFAENANASANLKWLDNNGIWSSIDLNGTDAGTDVSFQWDADGSNYIGVYQQLNTGYVQYNMWNNISVHGEVPEPSSLAMLVAGLAGLLAYAWKKRK